MTDLIPLKDLSVGALESLLEDWGYPKYRARQLMRWMYQERESDFANMTDLPLELRQQLKKEAEAKPLRARQKRKSKDGTIKFLLEANDGQKIETVLIPAEEQKRTTVCISSQVGCAMGCSICATGKMGFSRNLSCGEIIEQVILAEQYAKQSVTNIVFMGMGEPLANYEAVLEAIFAMIDPERLALGSRRITVSTCGLVPQMRRLADEKLQIGLAISLHAPEDGLRDQLVPINKKHPIKEVLEAASYYVSKTNRRVTFEYALIDGVNDSTVHASKLGELLVGLLCHVNLIPVNPANGFSRSSEEAVLSFQEVVRNAGIPVTVRSERGVDISAACGQLAIAAARVER
ncbi:MAG: 23S rRNA (adenine(2503)-C(2))-methyltransferase RlmN [Limnochordia bacterium]|nr:23S rRNA (adenine(2503)-C(2))-methyltransferase RlmN [Limnochordia bacterium]MDD2629838.1 23S rRNA (adenine(2503)-C(2))-methyltransferase RlmN [Limnochordia bacterium]